MNCRETQEEVMVKIFTIKAIVEFAFMAIKLSQQK